MTESNTTRAAALAAMREHFRGPAEQNMALYREFCGHTTSDDDIESGMNMLWLQSVTSGSESYKTYLVSPLWKIISDDVLLRDRHRCAACQRDAEMVHHLSYAYEVMAGLDDEKLLSLCQPCHRYIHFHKMQKTPKEKWDKRLQYLQKFFARKRARSRGVPVS